MDAQDQTEIEAMFTSYQAAWAANDPQQLETHWDRADPAPVYLAEEIAVRMTDWDAIRGYWNNNREYIERVRLTFSGFTFKSLHEDLVTAVFDMRWDIRFRSADTPPMGGDNRVVATVRRVGKHWRLIAWVEAPLAALPYLQQLYARNVAADF